MKTQTRIDRARRLAVNAAVADEHSRFRQALANGKEPILQTAFGPHVVVALIGAWDYVTYPQGKDKGYFNTRTFYGCNDGSWQELMEQVGEPRNLLFQEGGN